MKKIFVLFLVLFILSACKVAQAAPFDSPLSYKQYLSVVTNNYPSKKCVAIDTFDSWKISNIGSNCTYSYSPSSAYIDGIEMLGMVTYPDGTEVTGNTKYLLGYNEPDVNGITPQMAIEMWPVITVLNPDKKFVSPAPTQYHTEWLSQFYYGFINFYGYVPKIDVLAIHCYQSADYCINTVSQIINYSNQWNISEVWVTEFAFSSSWQSMYPPTSTWQLEAQKFISWMQDQPKVTRFYWWALSYDSTDPTHWWTYNWPTALYIWPTNNLNERGIYYKNVK